MKIGIMDEPAFNIKFVEIVKRHPCLYDFTSPDYSKREANDHAWAVVSSEMKMSVPQCKEKWRNLRTALARSLKLKKLTSNEPTNSSAAKPKKNKEYYLKEAMGFILPFLRSKGPTDGPDSGGTDAAYEYSNDGEVYNPHCNEPNDYRTHYDPRHFADCSPAEYSSSSSVAGVSRKRSYEPSADEDYSQCYEMTPNTSRIPTRGDAEDSSKLLSDCFEFMQTSMIQDSNPDLQFLKSLLPDISKMNDHQKRQFKKRTLDVIDSILCNSFTQIVDST
nr:PREDICTED: uncharacterized protein LOC109030499 [Bemisia tabaci]